MRPLIGISAVPRAYPTLYGEAEGQTCTDALCEAVLAAGAVPVVLPVVPAADAAAQAAPLGGLVLAGGHDVDAVTFGARRDPRSTWVHPARDAHELALLRVVRRAGSPTLGVCRGLHLANVALGGDLVGHVEGHDAEARHAVALHAVDVVAGSLLAAVTGAGRVDVNTLHHQVVGRLAEGLRAAAWSADGHVEAAEGVDGPWLVAVQWHPELMAAGRAGGRDLFEALVAEAAGRRRAA